MEDSQSSDSESDPVQKRSKKTKTITIKKKTKSEKFLINKRKIIESISPVLLRKTLQHILDFLLKKEEASIIFSDLAPVEAKFLENFLGIYNKRISFRDILSPACNEMLDKMCEFFKEFDKVCKLEVYAAKFNVHTKKREVTFMKVPRYTRTNVKESQKRILTPQVIAETIQSIAPFKKENIPKLILSQTSVNSHSNITTSHENTSKGDAIGNREMKSYMNAENGEGASSTKARNREEKLSMNAENKGNKELKLCTDSDSKDNKFTKNLLITDKLVILNKDLLKYEIDEIALSKSTAKTIPAVKKIDKPTISKIRARSAGPTDRSLGPTDRSLGPTDRSLGPRKDKLLLAMSTPLESDKAMRMMRLMGWQGGALGLRGEGIVEPIIPALDIIPGKGLGHVVKEKQKSTKSVKPVKKSKADERQASAAKTSQTEERLKPVSISQTDDRLNPVKISYTDARLKPVKTFQTEEILKSASISQIDDRLKPVKICQTDARLKSVKTSQTEERLKLVKTSQIEEEPPKPVKNVQIEEPTKPVKLSRQVLDRIDFLYRILDLISKDKTRREQAVTYPVQLSKRQKMCYDNIVRVLNKRKHTSISLTEHENRILCDIASVMETEAYLTLDMMVSADRKELTITKKVDFVINTSDRMRWPTLLKETQNLQENINIGKQMTKSEFEIHICSTVLEFLESEDTEKWIDFGATLTEKCCEVVETICTCVNNKVAIPYKLVKELSDKILEVNNACFLDVQFYAKPTRSILLRKLNFRKPAINTEVVRNIIKRYIDTTGPDTDSVNDHREPGTIKTNTTKAANKDNTEVDMITNKAIASNIDNPDKMCERLNTINDKSKPASTVSHPFIDSIHNSGVDYEEIKENVQKTIINNECSDLKRNNYTANSSEDITSVKFKRFPLYVKDLNIGDNNDFRRVDMDLIQVTINLLTYNNKHAEYANEEPHDSHIVTNDGENNDFNINDNSKYTKLNNKPDIPSEITDNNMRKWYAHSKKFLIRANLVENKDSNNNKNQVTNLEKNKYIGGKVMHADLIINTIKDKAKHCFKADTDDTNFAKNVENKHRKEDNAIELEILNQDVEKQSQFDEKQVDRNVSRDLKLEDCNEIEDSTGDIESKESHQAGDKCSNLDTMQVKANNNEDLKLISIPEVCSDNQNSNDVIVLEELHQEVKKHSIMKTIQLGSNSGYKQDFEVFNDIKATIDEIESEISNQIKTPSKTDIIPIDGNGSKNLNVRSVHEVLSYDVKDSMDVIESKESHPVDAKHSEFHIVEAHNDELSDYESEEDGIQVIIHNEDDLGETEKSSESSHTDDANSKLDIIQVKSNYKNYSTFTSKNGPKKSDHNEETHSDKENKIIEENNIKDLKITNKIETDETKKVSKEGEIQSKIEMLKIEKTNCYKNLSRKRKHTELDESYEAVEMFCLTSVNLDNTEDLRLTGDLEESKKTEEINSKLDIPHEETDKKENSTLKIEFEIKLLKESHKLDQTDSKLDTIEVRAGYKENLTLDSEFEVGTPEGYHKIDETDFKLDIFQVGEDNEENFTLKSEFEVELLEESDKIDEIKSIYHSKHANENRVKDLNNVNKEIEKNCHDVVLIESNILEIEVVQKKIQDTIENMDTETECLPLLKYHGLLNKGIVYSCHNKETSLWLRNILSDYSVVDYKSAINEHKLKIKVTSFNKNVKKFFELLEVYNQGVKCQNWKIISEKHYNNSSLILHVEMDSNSFGYVCDNNFSLFVGYDIAQFTIGY